MVKEPIQFVEQGDDVCVIICITHVYSMGLLVQNITAYLI